MAENSKNPKRQVYIKFALLVLLFIGYFAYLSFKYDLMTGGIASLLTWSFFVLCTPVADAGFLLDFPLRLLFGIRMVTSEIVVWAVAILLNAGSLLYAPHFYETTYLTQVLHKVLTQPYPFWGIIILSWAGTFLSIKIADELMDVVHHHERNFFHSHAFKHELVQIAFLFFVIFCYFQFMVALGIEVEV